MHRHLRIGHLSTFYHTALLLMARKDLAESLGADADWTLFGTGPAIVKAFGRREIDLAYIGLPPAIIGIERGLPIVCVAGGHIEGTVISGGSDCIAYPETADASAVLGQFRGRVVGVPAQGSIHDVILDDALARSGLKGEVTVRNFPWADQITEAMARGEIAAAVGTPALAVAVQRYAGGKVLLPPQMLWPDNPSYGIVTTNSMLREERDLVSRFLSLHEEATSELRDDPVRAAQTIAEVVGIVDAAFILDVLRVSPRYCAMLTPAYIGATLSFVSTMKQRGYIGRELSSNEIFDPSLISALHPGHDHYHEHARM